MRIFLGIKLSEEIREKLAKLQLMYINDGNLTIVKNLHLTLVFIGEAKEEEVITIKQMLDKIKLPKFRIKISKLKKMRDMVIAEVEENLELLKLQQQLETSLVNLGFQIEKRKYYPHITLSRKTNSVVNENILLIENVNEVTLFLSEFTDKGVIYKELYNVSLK